MKAVGEGAYDYHTLIREAIMHLRSAMLHICIPMRHAYCEAQTILPGLLRKIVSLNAKPLAPKPCICRLVRFVTKPSKRLYEAGPRSTGS